MAALWERRLINFSIFVPSPLLFWNFGQKETKWVPKNRAKKEIKFKSMPKTVFVLLATRFLGLSLYFQFKEEGLC